MPPTETDREARVAGSGTLAADSVFAEKLVPNIEMIEPGAKDLEEFRNPAAFRIPPCAICGGGKQFTVKRVLSTEPRTVADTVNGAVQTVPSVTVVAAFPRESVVTKVGAKEAIPAGAGETTAKSTMAPAYGI
jgi:hypothetical protein